MKQRKTSEKHRSDILILGGGLMGLTLAAILGRYNITVTCIDREDPEKTLRQDFDGRTTALSLGSKRILSASGIWPLLEKDACPIRDIRIADGNSPLFLHFDSQNVGDDPFGWIVENRLIRQALLNIIAPLKTVNHIAPAEVEDINVCTKQASLTTKDGDIYSAELLIGADGRNSFLRQWAGIETRSWPYAQKALVCTIEHEHPHDFLALEHFFPAGPFAVLPMTNGSKGEYRSSIVWTEHDREGPTQHTSLMDLSEQDFNAYLQRHCGAYYGSVKLIGKRYNYPLSLQHAKSYIGDRFALIGDAAHGIHPIAGQGLNLGMRDAAVLAELIVDHKRTGLDLGGKVLLNRYQRARKIDNKTMTLSTDGLNRFFSNDLKTVRALRQVGLGIIEKIPPAKTFFMRQAMGLNTMSPKTPKLLKGETL